MRSNERGRAPLVLDDEEVRMMQAAAHASPVLYSRHEHGGHEVSVHQRGEQNLYEVSWPGGPQTYASARSLIRALYSGGDGSLCVRDPGMSFDRYFRTRQPEVSGGFVDLLGVSTLAPAPRPIRRNRLTVARPSTALRRRAKLVVEAPWWDSSVVVGGVQAVRQGAWARAEIKPTPKLTVVKPKRRRKRGVKLVVEGEVVFGIDLENRGHEVRKLLYACFGGRMARYGYDPKEVLQEVYRGILARNIGTCPWDIRKSSFGHYVHMVIECILANYMRKQRRIAKHEQVGVYAPNDGQWAMMDAAQVAAETTAQSCQGIEQAMSTERAVDRISRRIMVYSDKPEAVIAVLAIPHVQDGCQRREIAERISAEIGETVKPAEVSKALALLRHVTRAWASDVGLR